MKVTLPLKYAFCDSPFACAAAPIIARKWVPVIVCHLLHGPKRFNELRRAIPLLSGKVLSENLELMEKEDLLHQEVRNSRSIEVWYKLTTKGQDLSAVIKAMNSWGEKWLGRMISSPSPDDAKLKSRLREVAPDPWIF